MPTTSPRRVRPSSLTGKTEVWRKKVTCLRLQGVLGPRGTPQLPHGEAHVPARSLGRRLPEIRPRVDLCLPPGSGLRALRFPSRSRSLPALSLRWAQWPRIKGSSSREAKPSPAGAAGFAVGEFLSPGPESRLQTHSCSPVGANAVSEAAASAGPRGWGGTGLPPWGPSPVSSASAVGLTRSHDCGVLRSSSQSFPSPSPLPGTLS